jgi:glycosyltransferase involved in cell wall biosynthesis
MFKSPFFSIITPVLNGSCYVDDYLNSLRSQTFLNWEAIVVDDGSTDDTCEKIQLAKSDDDRFALKRLPRHSLNDSLPRGPYRPRNLGISIARGEYVCFLDIDDFWLKDKLMLQYKAIQDFPRACLLFGPFYSANSSLCAGYLKPFLGSIPVKTQVLFWNPVPNLTSCVRTTLARSNPFLAVNHEDFVFWHSVISTIDEADIVRIAQPLAIYRRSHHSTSGNKWRVLSWWLRCYANFGYPVLLGCLLLLVKSCAVFVEAVLVRIRVIPTVDLSSFSRLSRF